MKENVAHSFESFRLNLIMFYENGNHLRFKSYFIADCKIEDKKISRMCGQAYKPTLSCVACSYIFNLDEKIILLSEYRFISTFRHMIDDNEDKQIICNIMLSG